MSKRDFFVDINLNKNKIQNGGFENVSSLPTINNFVGRQVFLSTENKPYFWNGSSWVTWESIDNENFWLKSKANSENTPFTVKFSSREDSVFSLVYSRYKNYLQSREILCSFDDFFEDSDIVNFLGDFTNVPNYIRYNIRVRNNAYGLITIFQPFVSGRTYSDSLHIVTVGNDVYFKINIIPNQYVDFSVFKVNNLLFIDYANSLSYSYHYLSSAVTNKFTAINNFIRTNGIGIENSVFNILDVIGAIIEHSSQSTTGNFWNLLEANPETDYSIVQITNHLESIFPLLSNNYGNYLNSRNIYVDLSRYQDSYSYIMDLFGDIRDVPIGVRYHIFVGGYNNNLKIDFPLEYSTNWSFSHIPGFDGYTSELYCIPYSKAIKIEFIKLSDSFVWVDVENYGGMPGYSTATATNSEESTNNIVNYCNSNNVEINYNKDRGNAIFNLVDILSSITTKLQVK